MEEKPDVVPMNEVMNTKQTINAGRQGGVEMQAVLEQHGIDPKEFDKVFDLKQTQGNPSPHNMSKPPGAERDR